MFPQFGNKTLLRNKEKNNESHDYLIRQTVVEQKYTKCKQQSNDTAACVESIVILTYSINKTLF